MASQSSSRKVFIDSSIKRARSNGFHGLDLDWEYTLVASDMTNLGSLAKNSGKPPLILSATVSYRPVVDGLQYPVQSISRNLDWINVMTYDFYAPNRAEAKVINSHAALYDPLRHISAIDGIEAWTKAGVAAKKLVLGMPFYGYAWRLADANKHDLGSPASGRCFQQMVPSAIVGYRDFIAQNKAAIVHDSRIVTDYCYVGTTRIGYEDTQTISAKVSFSKQKGCPDTLLGM